MMWDLLDIYRTTIMAGCLLSVALAFLGCHLAARDRAMQTLCVGQGATVGVLFGIGLLAGQSLVEWQSYFGVMSSGLVVSGVSFWLSEKIIGKVGSSKNTYFTSFFLVLLALGYLVSAMFPALETHMAQAFFGDLATLSETEVVLSSLLAGISLFYFILKWREISNQSFEHAIFGAAQKKDPVFHWMTLFLLCLSVQFAGFIYTATCLFLPTALVFRWRLSGLAPHFFMTAALAILGTLVGFMVSLHYSEYPTVPVIVLVILAIGLTGALARGLAGVQKIQ